MSRLLWIEQLASFTARESPSSSTLRVHCCLIPFHGTTAPTGRQMYPSPTAFTPPVAVRCRSRALAARRHDATRRTKTPVVVWCRCDNDPPTNRESPTPPGSTFPRPKKNVVVSAQKPPTTPPTRDGLRLSPPNLESATHTHVIRLRKPTLACVPRLRDGNGRPGAMADRTRQPRRYGGTRGSWTLAATARRAHGGQPSANERSRARSRSARTWGNGGQRAKGNATSSSRQDGEARARGG